MKLQHFALGLFALIGVAWISLRMREEGSSEARVADTAATSTHAEASPRTAVQAAAESLEGETATASTTSDRVEASVAPTIGGVVEVELVDLDERSFQAPLAVGLAHEFDFDDVDELDERWSARAQSQGGRAVFEGLEFGRRFQVGGLGLPPQGFSATSTPFDGPTERTPRVFVRAYVRPMFGILRGVASAENGASLANCAVELGVASQLGRDAAGRSQGVETDASGAFEIPLFAAPGSAPDQRRIFVTRGAALPLTGMARFDEPVIDEFGRRIYECGEVLLHESKLLLAGRVVDESGAPIAGAAVSLFGKRNAGLGAAEFWPKSRTTDAAGRFEFGGEAETGGIALFVRADGYSLGEAREVTPRASDHTVVLLRAAVIRGRLATPKNTGASLLSVTLESQGSAGNAQYEPDVDSAGVFAVQRAAPGVYVARVSIESGLSRLFKSDDSEPQTDLYRSAPFEVRAGDVLDLGDLDLSTSLNLFEIEVVDAGGAPLRGAIVTPIGAAALAPIEDWTGRSGVARFVSTARSIDVRVSADGKRACLLEGVESRARAVLEEGLPVRVKLPAKLPTIEAPFELVVTIEEDNPSCHGVIQCFIGQSSTQFLSASRAGAAVDVREWRVHAPRPGAYMITASVSDTRTRSHRPLLAGWQGPFDVTDAGADVRLDLDLVALREFLRAPPR